MATLDPHAAAITHLSAANERLAALIARVGPYGGDQGTAPEDHFEGLVRAIISQQLSGKAADTIFGRLKPLGVDENGRVDPARLLALPEARLREAGLSGAKASSVRDLSTRVHQGELALSTLGSKTDDEVIALLCKVKGIGRWTAEMFLIFRLGRLDVLPVGDLGVQKGFQRLFGLRKLPPPERMVKLSRPFRPYRSVACWYLWRLNDEKPG